MSIVHLRGGGTSVVFEYTDASAPSVLHWGAELEVDEDGLAALGDTAAPARSRSSFDRPRRVSLLAHREEGWAGACGFSARCGGRFLVGFRTVATTHNDDHAVFTLRDDSESARITLEVDLTTEGLLIITTEVQNAHSQDSLEITALRSLLPLPSRAVEALSLTGRWGLERQPQRSRIDHGTTRRASRRGRPGHDSPLLLVAGTSAFGWETGEVWGTHIGWSGSTEHVIDKSPEGAGVHSSLLGGGMLLDDEAIILAKGQSYRAPKAYFVRSSEGLNGVATALHAHVRRSTPATTRPRPVILNTWEAAYFDLDVPALRELADLAADLGVERFVIDDGWFRNRRSSDAGLGDWYVDEEVWQGALPELAEHIRTRAMEFGLWFEPEMVNPDSDLARAHPDWVLTSNAASGTWRGQHALNLSKREVREYLVERLSAIIDLLGIAYIKWDHNRDVVLPMDAMAHLDARGQTDGLYEVLERIRAAHPGLEIESCASGGARVDLGMLPYVERYWTSDTNDPVERQTIQRWTQLLLPPEMVGTHLGPTTAHTTERTTSLDFRLITAFFGHAGIEWNIAALAEDERVHIQQWISEHKRLRPLLHSGDTRVADLDHDRMLHGVVSASRDHAVFAWVRQESSVSSSTERIRFPGLDPHLTYRIRRLLSTERVNGPVITQPSWFLPVSAGEAVEIPGAVLTTAGVPLPLLHPASAVLLELNAV